MTRVDRVLGACLAVLVSCSLPCSPALAQQAPGGAARPPAPATPPAPTLGPHAPLLEGTWELVSMTLPDGTVLRPPIARGVIVIDKGVYLAASYLQPTSVRTVGNIWEGQLILNGERFDLVPQKGYRYDSMAEQRVHGELPPPTRGSVKRTADGLVFVKDSGGTVTFPTGGNRRVQSEPDGTVIEHARTSLVPRIPEDLPGRIPESANRP